MRIADRNGRVDVSPNYAPRELQRQLIESERWNRFKNVTLAASGVLLALAAIGLLILREWLWGH